MKKMITKKWKLAWKELGFTVLLASLLAGGTGFGSVGVSEVHATSSTEDSDADQDDAE